MAHIRLLRWIGLALALCAATAWAQEESDEIDTAFRKLVPAEEQRLRQILAAPIPSTGPAMVNRKSASPESQLATLTRHFQSHYRAARLLGDAAAAEAVLGDAVRLLPDAHWRNKLGDVLLAKGQIKEGNAMNRQAVALADPYQGAVILANIACNHYQQHQDAAARAAVAEVAEKVKAIEKAARTDSEREFLFRAAAKGAYCLSLVEQRQGHFAAAAQAAEVAEQDGRRSLSLRSALGPLQQMVAGVGVALSIQRKVSAYRAAGRLQDAEKALADYLRLSSEVQLPANHLAGVYATAGGVRFDQREFSQSEQFYRKADRVVENLGLDRLHTARTIYAREIISALAGQRKWQAALAELDRLDQLAGTDRGLQGRVRFSFNRALVYFGCGRFTEAAALFGQVARTQREQYGVNHFLTAQAAGLQGAALWRSAEPANQARALPLLKAAVRDYMAPANADYLENIGLRKELRDITFSAYLEAMALTAGEDASGAIGAADWVRGGLVQEALADAALRAAAGTAALADIVRSEQDAKNEVRELRRYLAGEGGAVRAPMPEVAAQMRERIASLEAERARLHADIKTRFPDYDRLVRPAAPSVADIAQQLNRQQALLMLLPTAESVYVWAVAADRPPGFARVPLDAGRLAMLVSTLRHQLEVGANATPAPTFDAAAAFELFDRLLAPLAPVWRGKAEWIVAPGGMLSRLPFALLHTRAGGGQGVGAPWLIKDAAVTQVPSLSAWLSIKAMAGNRSASLPFAGWGDPAFGTATTNTAAGPTAVTPSRHLEIRRIQPLANLDHPEATVSAPAALRYADIPPLPETRAELLAIASALQADPERDVLLGRMATRASVLEANQAGRLADRRVLAFATHGLMAGDLPNLTQPALAMAATGTEDKNPFAPLLTLEDVLTLKLNADWVVLSACNTAAADGKAEEALSGLARGFFYAGSRSLLVTHWAVESESARELTTSTFAHYAANPTAPKAESLRQAMLKVMAMPQFSHPAYWAPYALVGDGGR